MVAEWIATLAASGAGALVGAAATDAWQTARTGVIALFRRGGTGRAEFAAAQLDSDAKDVENAAAADRDQVRQKLLPLWQGRLTDLLAELSDNDEDSEVADELRELTRTVWAQLPASQQSSVQHITASAPGAIAQGAIGGNVITYNYGGATSTTSDRAPADGGDTAGHDERR
jgi:hypothetical protein